MDGIGGRQKKFRRNECPRLPPLLKDVITKRRGLTLIVGATGSGKSTTLAAMIDHRNSSEPGHIVTIEDPVEFVHRHKKSIVNQREVGFDTLSFNDALKSAMRQSPDVILIGEIRDWETMEAAITFADTGHLCLATLHSTNANQTFERIINFFFHLSDFDFEAQVIHTVGIHQRLIHIDFARDVEIEQRHIKGLAAFLFCLCHGFFNRVNFSVLDQLLNPGGIHQNLKRSNPPFLIHDQTFSPPEASRVSSSTWRGWSS